MPALRPLTAVAVLTLALTACGADSTDAGSSAEAVTVTNCGEKVTFEKAPERVVLLNSDSVTYLHELGVLDRVVARAGAFPRDYYDDETWAELEKIPLLTDQLDSSGHLQISKEVVLAQRPDLVLGEAAENLNRDTLAAAGIPMLMEPAMCPEGVAEPGYQDLGDQLRTYGAVFGVAEQGEEAAEATAARVEEIAARIPDGETRTAAVLYPTVGGGVSYAYGTRSMAHPQLEAAGFTNVFADVDERVFEVTREELIGRNPDVLVLLHNDGSPAAVKAAITDMAGASQLQAVKDDAILTQLFNFTEPPTLLSLDGLERIAEAFAR